MKSLPHAEEAEKSVLGAVLLRNDSLGLLDLDPDDFFDLKYRETFKAMRSLESKRKPIDPVLLEAELGQEAYNALGGIGFFSDLLHGVVTADNIEHYAQEVKKKSVHRKLVLTASDIATKGLEDPDDEFLEYASRKFLEATQSKAEGGPRDLKSVIKEAMTAIDEKASGKKGGLPTGFHDLDVMLCGGLRKSNLVILAARPGCGKTSLAMNIGTNLAFAGHPGIVFSLEMSAPELGMRLLSSESGVCMDDLLAMRGSSDIAKMGNAANRLAEHDLRIDDRPDLTLQELRVRARRWGMAVKTPGIVIVDYLQLLKVSGMGKNAGKVEEVTAISRGLKQLAKELDCPVLALSQLNRNVEARDNKRPVLSDLRDSGSIEQDADVVLFIYRDDMYNQNARKGETEIIVAKQRSGPRGELKLQFNERLTRFDNHHERGF